MIAQTDPMAARTTVTLGNIESLSRQFDCEARELDELIAALEADLEEVKRKHLAKIRKKAAAVAECQATGLQAVEAAPELFVKPRSLTVHGVKSGYVMAEGRLVVDDPETTCRLIHRLHRDDVDLLIRTKEEPNKDALRTMTAQELAKLGCRIEGAGDQPIFKRVKGDVEKLFEKLMSKLVEAMVKGDES